MLKFIYYSAMVQGDNRGMLNTYAYIQILRNIIILIPCSVNPLRRFLACRPLIWFLYGLWFLVGCLVVCCFLSPPPPHSLYSDWWLNRLWAKP